MQPEQPKKRLSPAVFALIVVLAIVGSCVFLSVTGLGLRLLQMAPGPAIEGQEARLTVPGGKVLFSRDLPTFEQVTKLNMAADADAQELDRLSKIGAVFLVADGTRVRVLDANVQHYQVQIIDGEHAGAIGYVPAAFVKK